MRNDRVIVGMDFSDAAIAASRWIVERFAPDAHVTLVHAVERPPHPHFAAGVLPDDEFAETYTRESAQERLRDIGASLGASAIDCVVTSGAADEAIAESVRATHADLVVIGPHGERPRPRKFLGTTAERIVHHSPVSVIVATQPPPHPPRSLLVAVDDASITPRVLAVASDIAGTFDAQVKLLHVWSNAVYSHVASMCYAANRDERDARREIEHELHDASMGWLTALAESGMPRQRVSASVMYGHAGDRTLELARAIGADMIVLGRHGAGLARPRLLGTTVNTVLHGATCPVFVVVDPTD